MRRAQRVGQHRKRRRVELVRDRALEHQLGGAAGRWRARFHHRHFASSARRASHCSPVWSTTRRPMGRSTSPDRHSIRRRGAAARCRHPRSAGFAGGLEEDGRFADPRLTNGPLSLRSMPGTVMRLTLAERPKPVRCAPTDLVIAAQLRRDFAAVEQDHDPALQGVRVDSIQIDRTGRWSSRRPSSGPSTPSAGSSSSDRLLTFAISSLISERSGAVAPNAARALARMTTWFWNGLPVSWTRRGHPCGAAS